MMSCSFIKMLFEDHFKCALETLPHKSQSSRTQAEDSRKQWDSEGKCITVEGCFMRVISTKSEQLQGAERETETESPQIKVQEGLFDLSKKKKKTCSYLFSIFSDNYVVINPLYLNQVLWCPYREILQDKCNLLWFPQQDCPLSTFDKSRQKSFTEDSMS